MMPTFEEYAAALNARDTIARIVSEQLERDRPRYRYGYVQSIDRVNRLCQVQFVEGGDFVTVQMGSLQPQKVGQIVRVAGLMGDRFVDDVMGAAVFDNGTAREFSIDIMTLFTGQRTGVGALTWNQVVQNSAAFLGGYDQSGGGQGAWKEEDIYLEGGLWYIYSYAFWGPNTGILTITVDGASAANNALDTYQASTYVPYLAFNGGPWTLQPGMHTIRVTCTDKNASSTGYYGLLSTLKVWYAGPLT